MEAARSRGAEEDAVDAGCFGDGPCVVDALGGFDLDEHRDVFGTVEQVALDAVPAGRAGQRAANAANADGWILRGGGDVPGLFGRRDHRHENGLRAEVEYLLDGDGIAEGTRTTGVVAYPDTA